MLCSPHFAPPSLQHALRRRPAVGLCPFHEGAGKATAVARQLQGSPQHNSTPHNPTQSPTSAARAGRCGSPRREGAGKAAAARASPCPGAPPTAAQEEKHNPCGAGTGNPPKVQSMVAMTMKREQPALAGPTLRQMQGNTSCRCRVLQGHLVLQPHLLPMLLLLHVGVGPQVVLGSVG